MSSEFSHESLHQLYEDFHGSLYNFAMRWVFNESIAEELVHEAFLKVWNSPSEIDMTTVKSLLFKILQNQCISFLRRQKVWSTIQSLDPISSFFIESGETKSIENQEHQKLKERLSQVPTKYRQVLLLFYFGEFSYMEIAKILEISEGTVASRKNRALQLLKTDYSEEIEYAL